MPLKILLGVCLLRANPQDLPASSTLMYAALAAYGLSDVIGVINSLTLSKALIVAAVDVALLMAATHLMLQWRKVENRLPQTLLALAGCGALLSLLAWTLVGLTRDWLAPEWIWGPFLVWYILVFGHVLRQALTLSMAAGVAASLVSLILSMSVTGLFMNPPPAAN